MSKDTKNNKVRHSSLEMPDAEVVKKKYDMLTKARNKLFNFGDKNKAGDVPDSPTKKTGKYSAIECLFKATHKPIEGIIENASTSRLKKQNSISGYPIKIKVEDYNDCTISRDRPSTICVDKIEQNLGTAALALERPRKKLSFKEPEKMTYANDSSPAALRNRKQDTYSLTPPSGGMKRSISFTNGMMRTPSFDDFELESHAMRIVRTVGQAFEVCHKLSITAPENENLDQEEQETLTQDLLSDRLSDVTSDKCRKDYQSEIDIERLSLPGCDDSYFRDNQENKGTKLATPKRLDTMPPSSLSNNKSSSLMSAETYSSPHSDVLTAESAVFTSSLPSGSTLTVHHEIQLLKEQLEQQSQQTQAAMAQLQLAREQLAAEQAARMEAQSRTHQLLVHNRELLDHIAALVSHLHTGSETSGGMGSKQQNSPHVTLPQHQPSGVSETYMPDLAETSMDSSLHQSYGINPQDFIENRPVTSCMPPSPLNTFNPTGNVFNFPYSQQASFDNQLLQTLQGLSGYTPSSPYNFNFNPTMSQFQPPYYPSPNILNNNFTLPNKYSTMSMANRNSYPNKQMHAARHSSEPRQIPYQYSNSNIPLTKHPSSFHLQNLSQQTQMNTLDKQIPLSQMNQQSPSTSNQNIRSSPHRGERSGNLIKPLSQIGPLTTTDSDGKVRVIVPVPSSTSSSVNNNKDTEGLLANLRLTDDFRMNGAPIQRTISEKVPNRSELMAQVQRAMWARHTTK